MNVLEVKDLGINFGGLRAVDHFNLTIKKGELYGLIGPNGAGKTTVFNMLTGVYAPSDGKILLQGKNINNLSCHKISQLGIARTFQNIRLFKDLSVIDNVKIGLHERYKYNLVDSLLRTKRYFNLEQQIEDEAMELLELFRLHTYARVKACNLPYGKQRELEIARALATHPILLLLDEPAAGMNPQETQELMEVIKKVRKNFDVSILLIEHDMKLVMGICERITVLNYGSVLLCGTPEEVVNDPQVIKAYLGD